MREKVTKMKIHNTNAQLCSKFFVKYFEKCTLNVNFLELSHFVAQKI